MTYGGAPIENTEHQRAEAWLQKCLPPALLIYARFLKHFIIAVLGTVDNGLHVIDILADMLLRQSTKYRERGQD